MTSRARASCVGLRAKGRTIAGRGDSLNDATSVNAILGGSFVVSLAGVFFVVFSVQNTGDRSADL